MAYEVKWPGWDVVDKIGAGSFGAVYRIRREMLGEEEFAALKVISIPQSSDELEELQSQGYDAATITTHFQKYLEDIIKEYSLMRKIKGNTNVVYCDDIQYVPKPDGFGWTIYIKMELLNPLMKNLHQVNSEAQVVKLAKDLCNALELCREQNIIHRDIKPQNVFISDHGSFKLGDFGIAKTVERTSRGTKIGTYKYMAPEVFHNRPYGHNADIYSLGLLLYWLLNEKRTPFLPAPPQIPTADTEDEAMMRRFRGDPIPAPAHGSPELAAVVLRACAADPAVRYQTAGEMLADLSKLVPSTAPFAAVMPTPVFQNDHTVSAFAAPVSCEEDNEGTVSIFGRAPVVPPAPAAPVAPASPAPAPAQPKQKKGKKGLVILLLLVLVAAIAVTGIVLLPKLLGSDEPSETDPPATQATDPTDSPTDPTDAPTDPTDEPTDPTDPTDAPTEPTDAPTDPAPVLVEVPDVTNKSEQEAADLLEQMGFIVERQYAKDEQVAEGFVITQSARPGDKLEIGSEVTITISSGRETIAVENVTGKTAEEAKSILEAQGFKVAFQEDHSDTVAAGYVISQSPKSGSSQYAGTTITVTISKGKAAVIPSGVKLNKTSVTLEIKGTVQLSATVTPANADDTSVIWISSNAAIAKVSDTGLVTAVGPGTATITVKTKSGEVTATCTILVKDPTIAAIANQTLLVGDTKYINMPAVTPASNFIFDYNWTSSNPSAVNVYVTSDMSIGLEALKAGTSTVTVSYTAGGKTVSTSFTVTVNTPSVTLGKTNITFTWDTGGASALYTTNNIPSWRTALPTATTNTGATVRWKVQSGTAFIRDSYVHVTNPGEKVVVRAYVTYNGTEYYADCTVTLTLVKTTSASNYLRKGAGTNYGYYTSIPSGKTVTITKVYYNYSSRNANGQYWVWGQVTYGGYTGWVVIY